MWIVAFVSITNEGPTMGRCWTRDSFEGVVALLNKINEEFGENGFSTPDIQAVQSGGEIEVLALGLTICIGMCED